MNRIYFVDLTEDERVKLEQLTKGGTIGARKL